MITAIDTNIIIDILQPDPQFGPSSKSALQKCMKEGSIVACSVVWAELATVYSHSLDAFRQSMMKINLEYSDLSKEAALKAAVCWAKYRKNGGTRNRIASDFLIGGHALVHTDRLLTRDKGFFKDCFNGLKIVGVALTTNSFI